MNGARTLTTDIASRFVDFSLLVGLFASKATLVLWL